MLYLPGTGYGHLVVVHVSCVYDVSSKSLRCLCVLSWQHMSLPVWLPFCLSPGDPDVSPPPQQHSNASQSLCDIIRLSREQMMQGQDSLEPDQLLATLEKWVCGLAEGGGERGGVSVLGT